MLHLLSNFKIAINQNLYIKDPSSSDLGKKIITNAIDMIDEIGFENFTFRKLGQKIDSPEASIYRYFENKHKLLIYLISWYWGWLEYEMVLKSINILDPKTKLKNSIEVICDPLKNNITHEHFNLKPRGIVDMLDLLRPIYKKTAAYGHFGREEDNFSWEKTDKADALRHAAGL